MTITLPTAEQKNQMLFNATCFGNNPSMNLTLDDATWRLEFYLTEKTDLESLAESLHFHKYISAIEAARLSTGKGWTGAEMSDEEFYSYANRPKSRFRKSEVA